MMAIEQKPIRNPLHSHALWFDGTSAGRPAGRPPSSGRTCRSEGFPRLRRSQKLAFFQREGRGISRTSSRSLLAAKLGKSVSYTLVSELFGLRAEHFGRFRCDVIMGFPQGDDIAQVTNPYYSTAYALVFKPGCGLDCGRLSQRSAPQGQAHRHRGRHPAFHRHGRQRPHDPCQTLSARYRYARRFVR